VLDFLKRNIAGARATKQSASQERVESTEIRSEMVELHEDEFFCIYSSVSGAGHLPPAIGKL
jgi:hypothetical protein